MFNRDMRVNATKQYLSHANDTQDETIIIISAFTRTRKNVSPLSLPLIESVEPIEASLIIHQEGDGKNS